MYSFLKLLPTCVGLLFICACTNTSEGIMADTSLPAEGAKENGADGPAIINNALLLKEIGIIDEHEVFSVSATKTSTITTEGGIRVTVPKGAFVDAQGRPVDGAIDLKVKDMMNFSEMFSENVSTVTRDGMLATRGMIELKASQNGTELGLAAGKSIDLTFPGNVAQYEGAEIYYGAENDNGVLEWEKGEPATSTRAEESTNESQTILDFRMRREYHEDLKNNSGFLKMETTAKDSLRYWLALSEEEIIQVQDNPINIYWTLFSDGDFEIYHADSDLPTALMNKIVERLNAMPRIAAFNREGGTADVSGVIVIYARSVYNQIVEAFSMKSYRLGWINCDVFYRIDKPLINMIVKAPNQKSLMKMIFNGYQTIVSGVLKEDGNVYFSGIPEGEEIKLMTLFPEAGKARFSITETLVQAKLEALADFETLDKTAVEDRLDEVFD